MTIGHIVKVSIAVLLASAAGWISLFGLNTLRVWQAFEGLAGAQSDAEFNQFDLIFRDVLRSMEGGSTVFLCASLSCAVLSEVLRSRSILYYVGLSGALALIAAAAVSSPAFTPHAGQAGSALPIAGFVAGAVYWLIARPS